MALATRCPNCQVLFRVVADQLKLRGGLVRCGACRHVFDAIGSLTYIEDNAAALPELRAPTRKAAPPTLHITAGSAAILRSKAEEPRARLRSPPPPADAGSQDFSGPPTLLAPDERAEPERREEPVRASRRIEPKFEPRAEAKTDIGPEARAEARSGLRSDPALEERSAPGQAVERTPAPGRKRRRDLDEGFPAEPKATPGSARGEIAADDSPEPEFLRVGNGQTSRGFSVFYGGGSALLAILLLLQLAVVFRTELTTRWPQWRPALVQLCGLFGCNVGWPTRAELLAVVGTELQAVPGTDVLELTAVIRNRASFRVALPAIEVTLTDTTNRTLARKVFAPVDYLASAGEPSSRIDDGLGAGSDYTIKVAFEARGVTAVGFVVYPFYL